MKNKIFKIGIFLLILLVIPHDYSISLAETDNKSSEEIQLLSEPVSANCDMDDSIGYLVITTEQFKGALDSLIVWKTQKGLNAKIKTIEEINTEYLGRDIQEKMKNCIIDQNAQYNTQWVLLAGDNPQVPSRDVYVDDGLIEYGDDGETVSCDFYYSDLNNNWDSNNDGLWGTPDDELDFEPEIYVGRLTANNRPEMEHLVNRILDYEKNPPVGSWMNQALFAGAMEFFDEDWYDYDVIDYSRMDANRHFNFINDRLPDDWSSLILGEAEGIQPTECYYDLPINSYILESALNEGYSIGAITGHGWPQGMVRSVFYWDEDGDGLFDWNDYSYRPALIDTDGTELNTLNQKLGMYFLGGCSCGTFDHEFESIQEYMLRTTAIGCIAGSHLVWGEDQWTERDHGGWYSEGLNSRFWEQLFLHNQPGKAFALAKADYVSDRNEIGITEPYYPIWENKTLRQFNLLGDPEVPIWLGIPEQLNYEIISNTSESIVINVSIDEIPIEDAIVTVYNDGKLLWKGKSAVDGMVEISGLEYTSDMVLTISKINYLPYQTPIYEKTPNRHRYRNCNQFWAEHTLERLEYLMQIRYT